MLATLRMVREDGSAPLPLGERWGERTVRSLRVQHRQCAWCLRLKHWDSHPHGQAFPRLAGYSHGICADCRAALVHSEVAA